MCTHGLERDDSGVFELLYQLLSGETEENKENVALDNQKTIKTCTARVKVKSVTGTLNWEDIRKWENHVMVI